MKLKHTTIGFLAALIAILGSCSPDPIITPEPTPEPVVKPWELHREVLGDNFSMKYLHVTEAKDRMFAIGEDYFSVFDAQHRLVSSQKFKEYSQLYLYPRRFFVNDKYFVYCVGSGGSDTLIIHSTRDVNVKLKLHLPTALRGYQVYVGQTNPCFIDKNNVLYVPVGEKSVGPGSYIGIYQLSESGNQITANFVEAIRFPDYGLRYVSDMILLGDELYVAGYGRTYSFNINTRRPVDMGFDYYHGSWIVKKDTLILAGYDGSTSESMFSYQVNNAWKTYEIGGSLYAPNFVVDNEWIRLGWESMFHFRMRDSVNKLTINYNAIETLGTGNIEDIKRFNDRVYIASLNGLFYKPANEWLTYRTK